MTETIRRSPSGRPIELSSDNVENESTITGTTLTDALDTIDAEVEALGPATGTATGYLQRLGFVNAASTKIGTTFEGAVLQAAVTWNTAAEVPPGSTFTWDIWASAGGAVGGKAAFTGSALNVHGAPSAGSAHRRFTCSRADILAALPLTLTAALGGQGSAGAQRLGSEGSGTTLPLAPQNGASSSVGSLATAYPGGAGFRDPNAAPSNRNGSSGGGTMSAGSQATGTAAVAGGNPGSPSAGATGEGGAGCVAFPGVGNGSASAEHGGASTTASGTATTTFQAGGTSLYGGSAGGWGAGFNTGTSSATNAGNGGGVQNPGIGGTSAVGNNVSATGSNGTSGADGALFRGASGGGGGGSAKVAPVDAITNLNSIGGNGGDGGFPAGGAGGGGDAGMGVVGSPSSGSVVRGGNGGKGGDGLILCTIT